MERFAASDGIRLAYHIDDFTDPWTAPATLLLLHAAMGSAKRYHAWVPMLARHYRVVRMDLRGHGNSEVPPADRPLTLDRLVEDVASS
jgi:3-oxoadipate enol-lactonase